MNKSYFSFAIFIFQTKWAIEGHVRYDLEIKIIEQTYAFGDKPPPCKDGYMNFIYFL